MLTAENKKLYFCCNSFMYSTLFLSNDEKFILKRDSSKLNLSQSEYIRNLIIGYEIKIPEVKEEPKPKKDEYIIENIAKALEENIECLIKVKNKFTGMVIVFIKIKMSRPDFRSAFSLLLSFQSLVFLRQLIFSHKV